MTPCDVSAVKFGAVSLMRSMVACPARAAPSPAVMTFLLAPRPACQRVDASVYLSQQCSKLAGQCEIPAVADLRASLNCFLPDTTGLGVCTYNFFFRRTWPETPNRTSRQFKLARPTRH